MLRKEQGELHSVYTYLEAPSNLSCSRVDGSTRPPLARWIARKGHSAVQQMLIWRPARHGGDGDAEWRLEIAGGDDLSLSGAEQNKNGHDVFIAMTIPRSRKGADYNETSAFRLCLS